MPRRKADATPEGGEALPVPADAPVAAVPESKGGPASTTFTLRDLLMVTYALPAEKVAPLVPEGLPLDKLPGPDGESVAFVQTLCALHADARWSPLPESAGQSFHQVTQRVLVRRDGRRGVFLLRTLIGSDEARLAQRALNRDTDFARFSVYIGGDPARASYERYTIRAVSDEGQTQFDLRAAKETTVPAPFGTLAEATAFFTDRPDTYFRAAAPRAGIGVQTWRYGFLPEAWSGELTAARVSQWTAPPLSLLMPDALLKPYLTLLFPAVTVTAGVPRYARFK